MLQKFIAKLNSYLDRLAPEQPIVPWRKALIISIGVGITLFVIAFLNLTYGSLEHDGSIVLAVFGVSALLIFLFPSNQLYSPLVILEANLLASFIALTCVFLFPMSALGLIVSIFCTTLGLYFLKCMHPPAFFLGVVIVITGIDSLGFAFYPIMVDSAILSLASYLYRAFVKR